MPGDYTSENEGITIPHVNLLKPGEIDDILAHSNVVKYSKRDVIFLQNTRTSHIMVIKSGLVKVYREGRNNKVVILKIAKPDTFLGLMSIFGQEIHQYSASAIEPTEIVFIDINVFRNVLHANGQYGLKIINLLSLDGLYIFNKLMGQIHKQLPGRIADVLLYFAEDVFKAQKFYLPFTRRELAELAGTTKESLIRTLTEFKNDKIIDLDGSSIEIKSLKIIKTLSELG